MRTIRPNATFALVGAALLVSMAVGRTHGQGSQSARSAAASGGVSDGASVDAMPTVDQVLKQYVESVGGLYILERLSTRTAGGTVTDSKGQQYSFDLLAKYALVPSNGFRIAPTTPLRRLVVVHFSDGDTISSYTGDAGWIVTGGGAPRDMTGAELDAVRLEDPFYFCMRMKQIFSDLQVDKELATIEGHEAFVLGGRTKNLPFARIYIDKESALLVRIVHSQSADGSNPTQIDFADYQNPDAAFKGGRHRIPFRWTVTQPSGNRLSYQLTKVLQNIPIDDRKFSKPT
jgi:hypothetical protein